MRLASPTPSQRTSGWGVQPPPGSGVRGEKQKGDQRAEGGGNVALAVEGETTPGPLQVLHARAMQWYPIAFIGPQVYPVPLDT